MSVKKCLVKTNGKRCKNDSIPSGKGQCQMHKSYFDRLVATGRMTWDFLYMSGEADLFTPKTKKDRRKKDDILRNLSKAKKQR